jgi:hypothetical protein
METCKAIQQQGANKGKQCWRPPSENGYCGKHQTVANVEKAKEGGRYKCSTHRCTNTISSNKHCEDCTARKAETRSNLVLCKGHITQGPSKGKPCDKEASTPEGYCGKHTLNILVNKATEEGKRICDDGKRACKNHTIEGKVKCEECLAVIREKEREQHKQLKESGKCLGCGVVLEVQTQGIRNNTVQRCVDCYTKLQNVEHKRVRDRNYKEEMMLNIESYYYRYQSSATRRNLPFEIALVEFTEMVSTKCHYCDEYNETEANGVDRVDSARGYVSGNVVACCRECNMMKGDLSLTAFLSRIEKIYEKSKTVDNVVTVTVPTLEENTSYVAPKKILELYMKNRIQVYIEVCIKEERSPLFVEKIEELKTVGLRENDVRHIIRCALQADTKSKKIVDRSRVSRKELFGFLKLKNVDKVIETYSRVHGEPAGFRTDVEDLLKNWKEDEEANESSLKRVIVKYQNKRNAK